MITVRYPNGQAITYNSAHTIYRDNDGCWKLLTNTIEKDGKIVAMIQPSAGITCEWGPPCNVENPIAAMTEQRALDIVLHGIRNRRIGTMSELAGLKKMLQSFNAKRFEWKKQSRQGEK